MSTSTSTAPMICTSMPANMTARSTGASSSHRSRERSGCRPTDQADTTGSESRTSGSIPSRAVHSAHSTAFMVTRATARRPRRTSRDTAVCPVSPVGATRSPLFSPSNRAFTAGRSRRTLAHGRGWITVLQLSWRCARALWTDGFAGRGSRISSRLRAQWWWHLSIRRVSPPRGTSELCRVGSTRCASRPRRRAIPW